MCMNTPIMKGVGVVYIEISFYCVDGDAVLKFGLLTLECSIVCYSLLRIM